MLAVYAEGDALANGRFPRAQQIVSTPGDPRRVFLRATFGVLASFDGGTSWRWLCEDAIGFSGTWDPPVAATSDGRLYMGLEHGLAWTTDACTIHAMPQVVGELVSDVSALGAGVVFATSTPNKPAAIWRDAKKLGATLDGFYVDTIDASPARIYATAVRTGQRPEPHLWRSDDAGKSLHELTPTWPTRGRLYLAAIDPKNDARVLVRQLSESGSDLLLSEDSGASFHVVLHIAGAMFGFAQSADGANVWAGSGDASEGMYRSTDRGRTFVAVAKAPIFCIGVTSEKLFTCSNPFTEHGYAIGASVDQGASITPLINFSDVRGPIACAASPCDSKWSAMHATFTTQTSSPSTSPPPSASASAPTTPAAPASRSSCACEISETRSSRFGATLFAALVFFSRRVATRGSRAHQSRFTSRRKPRS